MFKKIKVSNIKIPVIAIVISGIFSFSAHSQAKKTKAKIKKQSAPLSMPTGPKNSINSHSVGIGLGQTFVNGDFNENGEDKITGDLFYNYSASYSFDFMANFHYSKHEFRDKSTTLKGLALGIKGKIFQFDKFSPFGVAGLGFYSPVIRREVLGVILESESKITFGTHLGVGADLKLNDHVTVGLLAHYHNPFDVKQDVGPEVEGSYFKLLLTTYYTF